MKIKNLTLAATLLSALCTSCTIKEQAIEIKELTDFFLPIPIGAPLVEEGKVWGDSAVMPRDTTNGLEDTTLKKWCYWDGNIMKGDDGKYYMYASRWTQSLPHGRGWTEDSKGVLSVSDNLLGPYIDKGPMWSSWKEGKGANVVGLRLKDGRYIAVTSEITRGEVFVSNNIEGPFSLLGEIEIDDNGYYPGWTRYNELDLGAVRGGGVGMMANVAIFERHDGRYMIISRHCIPLISDSDVLGPYKALGNKAWKDVEGLPQFMMEDPTMWYSSGLYHIVVNHHQGDFTYHLTSEDGIDNWRNRGRAFHRENTVFKYTDGTVNDWFTVQRATAYVEDEQLKAFNFSLLDVHKGKDLANDNHGSKIMVVPFDSEGFDKNIKAIVAQDEKIFANTPLPNPWELTTIGAPEKDASCGYEADLKTQRLVAYGNKIEGNEDGLPYVYQQMSGDISLSTRVLYQDMTKENIFAGLMIRSSLEKDAKTFIATLSNDNGLTLFKRGDKGGQIAQILNDKNIKAPYFIRIEKRGDRLELHISPSNRYDWIKVAEVDLPLGEQFYVGTTATNSNSNEPLLARFKDTDAHIWGFPTNEGLISHTFPEIIPQDGKIEFEITYENNQALDYYIELESIETGEKYPSMLVEAAYKPKGTYKVVYDTGKALKPNSSYWICIKAVPFHFHDSEAIQSTFKRVICK